MFCSSEIDWAVTGAMLQGIGSILGALAVILVAILGANKISDWRKQAIAQRKFELAERVLNAAYKARDALLYIRGMFTSAQELEAAEAILSKNPEYDQQSPKKKQRLKLAQSHFNRINNTLSERQELQDCLPRAYAIFGQDVENAIKNILQQFHIISVNVESYIDDDGSDPEFSKEIRHNMSNYSKSEMTSVINNSVKNIEQVCLPILRDNKSGASNIIFDVVNKFKKSILP